MKKYSREDIESGVREVIARCMQLKTDEVKNDDLMKEDIGCDSIDCVEIVMELEKEFGAELRLARWLGYIAHEGDGYRLTPLGAYYFHYFENFYTLAYIDKMWGILRHCDFPESIVL